MDLQATEICKGVKMKRNAFVVWRMWITQWCHPRRTEIYCRWYTSFSFI